MPDPNINPNLLQAAINTLSSRGNTMQSTQTTPTLGKIDSSGFDHQRSGLETQAPPTFDSSGFDHQRSGHGGQATPTVVVHPLTTRGQQLKAQTVTLANQIIALTTNPNILLQL